MNPYTYELVLSADEIFFAYFFGACCLLLVGYAAVDLIRDHFSKHKDD